MAFIDELMKEQNALGISVEEPKAHDAIDREMVFNNIKNLSPELKELIQNLAMGSVGGGYGKGAGLYSKMAQTQNRNLAKGWSSPHHSMGIKSYPFKTKVSTRKIDKSPRLIGQGGIAGIIGSILGIEEGTPNWAYNLLEKLMPDPEMGEMGEMETSSDPELERSQDLFRGAPYLKESRRYSNPLEEAIIPDLLKSLISQKKGVDQPEFTIPRVRGKDMNWSR